MKRAAAFIMTGILISGIAFGSHMVKSDADTMATQKAITYDNMLMAPDIQNYLQDMNYLTEAEKQQLIKDEQEANKYYAQIDKLTSEVDRIADQIFAKHNSLFDEYDALVSKNNELWIKMSDAATDEQLNIEDNIEYINSFSILSAEEKAMLIEQEKSLDAYVEKMDKVYDEVDAATAELNAQIADLFEKAEEIHTKSQAIWDKIYDHEGQKEGMVEAVPY